MEAPQPQLQLSFVWPLAALIVLCCWKYGVASTKRLPPGPRALPLIGNLLDIPTKQPWLVYNKWYKSFGPIVSVNALGQHLIILNTQKAAVDLLDRRSAIYSSRPEKPILNILGFDWAFANQSYGPSWRRYRRSFHGQFNQDAAVRYQTSQMHGAHALVRCLLQNSEDPVSEVKPAIASSIIDFTYGILDEGFAQYLYKVVETANHYFLRAVVPGSYLVDFLPALKYAPRWFPGTRFQQEEPICKETIRQQRYAPYEATLRLMAEGKARPSVVRTMLEAAGPNISEHLREDISSTGAHSYAAGMDTTASSIQWFILALLLYPEVQNTAYREVCDVVGLDRLPDFADRKRMPYLNAIVLEMLRWYPAVPLGLPHATTEDDEYNGYFIPKGSVVAGHAWSILHDPETYPDPEVFKPERFLRRGAEGKWELDPSVPAPDAAFGYGRRVCPGRYAADHMLYAAVASIIATLMITPIRDEHENPILPKAEAGEGLIAGPVPFKCVVKPRSERAVALIDAALLDTET